MENNAKNNSKKRLAKKILLFLTGVLFLLGILLMSSNLSTQWSKTGEIEKILIGVILLFLIIIIIFVFLLPLIMGSIVAVTASSALGGKTGSEKKPIIFQVPKNHKWILRNVWHSNPTTKEGYQEKPEGWRFYIPTIWQSDEGIVNLTPIQLDLPPFPVNCKDGNEVSIDTRATYFISPESGAAINYIINTAGEKVEDLIVQRVESAVNQSMDYDSIKVIEWGQEQKEDFSKKCTEKANQLLKDDKGKDYGLQISINVQNLMPAPAIVAAADRKKAAHLEREAAEDEAKAARKIIEETGANPTWVMVAQTIADGIRGLTEKKSK